jgi:hypothetical protein
MQLTDTNETVTAPNTTDTGYTNSMWAHNRMKFNMDPHGQPSPPQWMYIGLQDIPSVTSTADTITYQEGQIFIEVECRLSLKTNFGTFTHGSVTKPYHETVFGNNDRVMTISDRGQGFIWGKPYAQDA